MGQVDSLEIGSGSLHQGLAMLAGLQNLEPPHDWQHHRSFCEK
jgi:hypothetical protein